MPSCTSVKETIIVYTESVDEEKIYRFLRREIFSPARTHNANLKFCTVSGPTGAESKSHTHPGDEIVFTLGGGNTNYLKGQKILLKTGQAISIPPGADHTTAVDSPIGWQGLSFYCDDCRFMTSPYVKTGGMAVKKSLDAIPATGPDDLQVRKIFSPTAKETSFLTVYALSADKKFLSNKIQKTGETVYYCLQGALTLSVQDKAFEITCGTAILLAPGTGHTLEAKDSNGFTLIAGSCSLCPLMNSKTTVQET